MKRTSYLLLSVLLLFVSLPSGYGFAEKAKPDPITIVIDPGHGGKDPGAIGVNGLYEKEVTLDISKRLADLLKLEGYEVILTRESDTLLVNYTRSSDKYLDLQARVDVATNAKADLFVSIHANSFRAVDQGTMVLYYDPIRWTSQYLPSAEMIAWSGESKKLAQLIQASVIEQVGTKDLGIVPSNVYVVRSGTVPSVLVETAFLSNWEEAEKLKTPEFRQAMAEAIRDGILRYRPLRFIDVIGHWAKDEIVSLSYMGIINGYEDHRFKPDRVLTRAELVTLLDKATGFEKANEDGQDDANAETPFSFYDVASDHWAYDSIQLAKRAGVIEGYEDGSFRPERTVTREEMATILYRYFYNNDEDIHEGESEELGVSESVYEPATNPELENEADSYVESDANPPVRSTFADVPQDHWANDAIGKLAEIGIIKGIKSDTFGLGQGVTRAEAATLLYRILNQNS